MGGRIWRFQLARGAAWTGCHCPIANSPRQSSNLAKPDGGKAKNVLFVQKRRRRRSLFSSSDKNWSYFSSNQSPVAHIRFRLVSIRSLMAAERHRLVPQWYEWGGGKHLHTARLRLRTNKGGERHGGIVSDWRVCPAFSRKSWANRRGDCTNTQNQKFPICLIGPEWGFALIVCMKNTEHMEEAHC